MSNIKYNEKEEAYELPYKLWGTTQTVRFYTENEEDIMKNLSEIAKKLDKLDGSKNTIAEMIIDDGYYEGGSPDALAKLLSLEMFTSTSTREILSSASIPVPMTVLCVTEST